VVEVTADDGVTEAISVAGSRAFAFGVQWHIEWHRDGWDLDSCISEDFRSACRLRRDSRLPAHRMQAAS
jgi:putative glutamine amidotransferase